MRQDYFEFDRTHKLVLVTNNQPIIVETTEAIWRRIRLVPFSVIVPRCRRDTQLLNKLRVEWPGILAWLTRGCLDWQREGLGESASIASATEAYRAKPPSSIDSFLAQCAILRGDLETVSAELNREYLAWCARVRAIPKRGKAFAAALKATGCKPGKVNDARGWRGIGLKSAVWDRTAGTDAIEPLNSPVRLVGGVMGMMSPFSLL